VVLNILKVNRRKTLCGGVVQWRFWWLCDGPCILYYLLIITDPSLLLIFYYIRTRLESCYALFWQRACSDFRPKNKMSKRDKEANARKSIWNTNLLSTIPGIKDMHIVNIQRYLIIRPNTESLLDIPYDRWSVPLKVQAVIKEEYSLTSTKIHKVFPSVKNKTTKLLIELFDGHFIEAVIMEHIGHCTLCVSSQIGCKMGCKFCATGTMGIIGNLTAAEICEQLWHALGQAKIRNVVFMGMGEPLDNYDNVKQAVLMMTNDRIFGIGPRHVTVSTVGVIKNMYRLTEDIPFVSLALSLHGPNQEVRLKIVPTAASNKFELLIEAMDNHIRTYVPPKSGRVINRKDTKRLAEKEVEQADDSEVVADDNFDLSNINKKHNVRAGAMIEYILIKDINVLPEHAHELGQLLAPRREGVYLNLIPYNPTEVAEDFESPTEEDIKEFVRILVDEYQIFTRVRHQMGDDVSGACGQLVVENSKSKYVQAKKEKKKGSGRPVGDIEELGNKLSGEGSSSSGAISPVVNRKQGGKSPASVEVPDKYPSFEADWSSYVLPSVLVVGSLAIAGFVAMKFLNKSK
jgi:adenine C2-methylase RlmN of 23S rRNA A2503 and tRNA A37